MKVVVQLASPPARKALAKWSQQEPPVQRVTMVLAEALTRMPGAEEERRLPLVAAAWQQEPLGVVPQWQLRQWVAR